jgi:hypothetical protein
MLSTKFEAPLRVKPEGSWLLAAMLGGVHLMALATVPLLALPLALKLALGMTVLFSLYRAIYTRILLRGKRSIRELIWEPTGGVVVWDGKGQEHEGVIAPDSFVYPWAVVLNLKLEGPCRRTLVLLADSVPEDVLRRLRIRLRIAAGVN